jgi:hypothetical protein
VIPHNNASTAGQLYIFTSSGCSSGKRAHMSRRSAKGHALGLRKSGQHLRPYQCGECGYWHVGHLPARVIAGLISATQHYAANSASTTYGRNYR